jgi:hypothetical protein
MSTPEVVRSNVTHVITVDAPLARDAEYRTLIDGRAVVILSLEGGFEARLVRSAGTFDHLVAEATARRSLKGMPARVAATRIWYRGDHGHAVHVLEGLSSVTVGGNQFT